MVPDFKITLNVVDNLYRSCKIYKLLVAAGPDLVQHRMTDVCNQDIFSAEQGVPG